MNCYEKYSTARLLTKEVLKMLPEDRDIGAQLTRVLLLIEERIGAESYYRRHERILSRKKVGYGMSKFANIQSYLDHEISSREDMKDMILRSALHLLGDCAHNFGGDANITEQVAQPLFFLNEIIDKVE